VLLVEDDPVVSHMVQHLLNRDGFGVTHASDGRQALEMLETETPTSVIVLDLMLPFAGGFEVLDRARALPAWTKVPILMLTSKSVESVVFSAFGAGVDDYLVKPFSPEDLVARVRRLAGTSVAVR
jgi:DNA-binding response OmpR family regulator